MSNITEGCNVAGTDMKGNQIEGIVTNVLNVFKVAIVRTGEDRTNVTEAEIKDLKLT